MNIKEMNIKQDCEGSLRVLRGGSWNLVAFLVRVARRDFVGPGFRFLSRGFRFVLRTLHEH